MKSRFFLQILCMLQLFTAAGYSKQTEDTTSTVNGLGKSFLALGDSYTIGQSVAASERFPAQTAALLLNKGIALGQPTYVARTGWTTIDLQQAIEQASLQKKYDVVSLLIGVNDQFQGLDTGGYRARFTQLLEKAIQLAGNLRSHVFVVSIPDYSVTPFGGGSVRISKEMDVFNAINKEIALANGIAYTDITPISRLAANDQTLTANDGLHPSGKQYSLWAQKLTDLILPILQ